MKKYFFLLFFAFLNYNLLAQKALFLEAKDLFKEGNYSASQSILNDLTLNYNEPEIMYLNARCSKELFSDDAIFLYNKLNTIFPYHSFKNEVNEDLALIFYRNKEYQKAINSFLEVNELSNEHLFKLAYSFFSLDSLEAAQFYFTKLMNAKNKFASPSKYYYAYISYKKGLYKSALKNFKALLNDSKFSSIVPYYISQIYFYQKEYDNLIVFAQPILDNVIDSRKSEIHRLLAEAYYRTNDFQNAIYNFEEFILEEKTPNSLDYFFLGHSYFKIGDYENTIHYLEKIISYSDSLLQYSSYYLGASYLKLDHYKYALQAFKKSASFDYNRKLQEDAYYNYAKLSYELELPFENTLDILTSFIEKFEYSIYVNEVDLLIAQTLKSTSQYYQAYMALQEIDAPNYDQQKTLQQLSFFLGVKSFNKSNFKEAITYFSNSNKYPIDLTYIYLSNFWLADCYFQLNDYQKAINLYSELSVSTNKDLELYENLKKYNLAYAYFQQADYQSALKYFRAFEKVASDSMKVHDTYLRIADCYFMLNDFSLSAKYYDRARKLAIFDMDYILYQNAVTLGLIGKDILKVDLLKEIITNFISSSYYDNSLHDLASYYKNAINYDLASKYYNDVIKYSKDENLVADAYLSKGMINFNNEKVDVAIENFLFVINNYPHTIYFKEALSGLQSAYTSIGDIEQYLAIIDSLPEISISQAEQDSLIYNTAFLKFSEMEYNIAKNTFDKYLLNFETGIFVNDAMYYNAISSLKIGDTLSAISNYQKLSECKIYDYQERALIFLARNSFDSNDYEKANRYYTQLIEIASSNSITRESLIRLMEINIYLENVVALDYAKRVVKLEKIDDWLLSKAYLIIARNEFESGNYAKSKSTFLRVVNLSKYDEGAEAKYFLAYLTYLDDEWNLAENMIFELAENYSSDHFIAKGFILLADIYLANDNAFQAKATLESIIENHDNDDLVNIARKKWELIVEREKEIIIDTIQKDVFISIFEDDIYYEVDEIDENYIVPIPDTLNKNLDSLKINQKIRNEIK